MRRAATFHELWRGRRRRGEPHRSWTVGADHTHDENLKLDGVKCGQWYDKYHNSYVLFKIPLLVITGSRCEIWKPKSSEKTTNCSSSVREG